MAHGNLPGSSLKQRASKYAIPALLHAGAVLEHWRAEDGQEEDEPDQDL
jgi:hypothetical protein